MKKTKLFCAVLLFLTALCLSGCTKNITVDAAIGTPTETEAATEITAEAAEPEALSEITIVYTNDIHAYVYNTVTDDDGNELPGLRLSNVAAMVDDLRAEGKQVLLVDAGDEVQGSVYGSYDSGESAIKLMNACGYQLACPGNHEFDYGVDAFFALTELADYPFISCNFLQTGDDTRVFSDTQVFDLNGTTVAFVGISAPETITTSTPVYFQDGDGNYLYRFIGAENADELYDAVQAAIDSVRDEADYVILLGHLGMASALDEKGISSTAVIANTEGADALIDAHSHTTIECSFVTDKSGHEVLLTQTGAYLSAVGVMTIGEDGQFTSELVTEYANADSEIAAMEDALHDEIFAQLGEPFAELAATLYIYNPDVPEQRLIRSTEMNAGDFVADAFYWFFNNDRQMLCDLVIENGGGIRCQLEAGYISYLDASNLCPFGNQVCLIEATGQEILDALEMGASVAGTWNEEQGALSENGGFLQVAGMQYTVDAAVESSVVTDDTGNFVSVDGDYRVRDVKVYNRDTGTYDDLELDRVYRVGGINYLLRNSGNGMAMFTDNPLILDFAGQDSVVIAQYAGSFASEADYPVICSENSPLYELDGYSIDYENPYGAGRISFINLSN